MDVTCWHGADFVIFEGLEPIAEGEPEVDVAHEGRIDLGIEVEGGLVGDIQAYQPPDRSLPPAVYEIGVALYDPADRGKGLGTEAV